jgi:hypothetical protein
MIIGFKSIKFSKEDKTMACCGKKDAKATKPADKSDSKKKSK